MRDKRFINGELYIPPNSVGGSDIQSRGTQNGRDYSDGGPGNRRRAMVLSFADENRDVGRADSYSFIKRPASSPAYDETEPKKIRDDFGVNA